MQYVNLSEQFIPIGYFLLDRTIDRPSANQ